MSAIWGVISLKGARISKDISSKMRQPLSDYKLDSIEEVIDNEVYMACGHQWITREDHEDKLPFYDEKRETFYTADCMIDNREELVNALGVVEGTPSGRLLYLSYLKWGPSFPDHILGVFTFVIYLRNEKRIILYTDHTASRCLHYTIEEGRVIFSTTINPILQICPRQLCEKWLVACEAYRGPNMLFFPELTPFEDIFQVMCGHYIVIELNSLSKTCYWDPVKSSTMLKFDSENEFQEHFLHTFEQCVFDVLKSEENTGITLSSGLDSSAVAAVAAKYLESEGKELYGYTSVPEQDYNDSTSDDYHITNESEGVKHLCVMYPNIRPTFVSCEGKSALNDLERYVRQAEMPIKSAVTIVWIDEIYRQAYNNNCKVVLKGQYGNSTISYGTILSLVYQLAIRGHIKQAYKELRRFKKRMRVSKRNIFEVLYNEVKGKLLISKSVPKSDLVKKSLYRKYHMRRVTIRTLKKDGGGLMDSRRQHVNFIYAPLVFQHLGSLDTRLGLSNGIIVRDPTKDRRIIELCLQYPIQCFVGNGVERKMVRTYLKKRLPSSITGVVNRRGLQSADFVKRIEKQWEFSKSMFDDYLRNESLSYILSEKQIEEYRRRYLSVAKEHKKDETARMLEISSLSIFLKLYKNLTEL